MTSLACLALCACTPDATWTDTTGKSRSDAVRKADYRVCYEKSGFLPDVTWAVSFNASMESLGDCMDEHGWHSSSAGPKRR